MPLVMVIRAAVRFFHHGCNSLAPSSHLSIGIQDMQAMRQAESVIPLPGSATFVMSSAFESLIR